MPELPEVETVRRGLDRWVVGRTILAVEVLHPRAVRRHAAGAEDFAAALAGRRIDAARRRGKYLWLPLDDEDALVGHLGMSGQLLVRPVGTPDETHLRVRFRFADDGPELRFVDQRTFGGLAYSPGGAILPTELSHIAADPLGSDFDGETFVKRVSARRTAIKRALLDQTLISGVGNIYADESLWRASLHWSHPANELRRERVLGLVRHVRDVLTEAIAAGGTSFDALYVDVDGGSGSFGMELAVYGRPGQPCPRCGSPVLREPFANRSSFFCLVCQRPTGDVQARVDTVAATEPLGDVA